MYNTALIVKRTERYNTQSLCCLYTERDLEWRICGTSFIDIDMLKRHTEYNLIRYCLCDVAFAFCILLPPPSLCLSFA
jgi:hypothetical protein